MVTKKNPPSPILLYSFSFDAWSEVCLLIVFWDFVGDDEAVEVVCVCREKCILRYGVVCCYFVPFVLP